jgi:hypothetical protein
VNESSAVAPGSPSQNRTCRAGRQKQWVKVKNREHRAMDRVMESFR